MSRSHQMAKWMTILTVLAWGVSSWAAAPAAGFDLSLAASGGGEGPIWALSPQGPGWLHIPQMQVRLDPPPPGDAKVWVEDGLSGDWIEVHLADGLGNLPLNVSTVSDLWALHFRVVGADGSTLKLVPTQRLVLTDFEAGDGVAPALTLTNWGEPTALRVKAVDLTGRSVELQTADVNLACSPQGEWYDLGVLPSGFERDIIVTGGQPLRYPVSVTVEDEEGVPTYAVLTGAPEAAPVGQVNYYGLTPAQQWNCGSGSLVTNATRMVITAISAPTTYSLYNLTDGVTFATGTISAKGSQATISSMTDGKSWKLATSRPVQAYMGYDCSGTLPGSMFYLADDGMLNYGTDFTVPLVNFSDHRLQYWVFATGAGTVTVKTLAGSTVDSHTFSAAGAWMIPYASITVNTVYTVSFAPSASGALIAVQQSSQNAATDVPAITQVASACTVTNVGRTFYTSIQQYSSDARIAAFTYQGTGTGIITATNLATGTVTTITTGANIGRTYLSGVMPSGAYRVDSTVNVGIIAGSPEGGTAIYDLGDDAFYYHGDGTDVRGHAMRCGGKVFVAQDGTNITGSCTPVNSSCGLPTISNPYNADAVLTITGNTANTRLFDLRTQDTQHTLLVEVFGGNCTTQLNDWSKVLQPAALGRPVITYPASNSQLLSTTPLVVGTAIPAATITLFVTRVSDLVQVFSGTAAANADGSWSIQVTTTLTAGVQYYFDAVQSLGGACSAVTSPTPGSSGSSGVINVTPPTVVTPADGSTTYDTTPTLSGTAPAGTMVTLTIAGTGGPYIVTTTADALGNYSVDAPVLPFATYSITAQAVDGAGNTSAVSSANSFTVAVLEAPIVTSPLIAGGTSVEGTSTANPGSTITVSVGGTPYTTTVGAGGTWSVTVPALVAGSSVNATVSADGVTSPVSNTVIVQHPAPVVTSPILAGASSISGTSASPDGTVITVYTDGALLGTATVAGGAWTMTGVFGLMGGEAITAVAAAGTSAASALSNTVVVTPEAPIVDGPLVADQTEITGFCTAPEGSTVTVTIGGVPHTATVQLGGLWSITVPPLVGGETVAATVTAGGQTSDPSGTLTVHFAPPVVTGPILAGASSISGTSGAADGTVITIYEDGAPIGTATVASGAWTLSGVSGLIGGESITAVAAAGTAAQSAVSNTVVVTALPSVPPIVSSSLLAGGSQTILGSSVEAPGSVIAVFVGGVLVGTTTVGLDGSWSFGPTALSAGQVVSATVQAAGKSVSTLSNQVVVSANSGAVTPPPVVSFPIPALATSVSGTSVPNAAVDIYADGFYLGTVTADGSGAWTLPGVPPLVDGTIVSATATLAGSGTSDWSAPVIVGTTLMLLRSDAMTTLTQARAPIFTHPVSSPPYPSLETIGPNHVFNQTEGPLPQPASPGTLDDDKAYIRNIHSLDMEPEPTVLTDNGRPLVFYELLDNNTKTLKLNKFTDGFGVVHIQFTITP